MEPVSLWAAVEFTACNGSTEALLTAAARAGLHPYGVTALPGGFGGRCAAWQYPRLAALARKHRVRLRIRRKLGLYFCLRPLLRRAGLWAGLAVFVPLLLFAQQFVWYADTSSLTTGQAARACAVLREAGLQPGAAVTEAKLTAGEYALLHSGEFSWASLNFAKGRLVVEAAAARPKPDIAAGTLHGIRAKCGGTVLRTNLTSGTMLVQPGQQVEAGQGLIGTARAERDGTLIFAPAAGTVIAQFEWSDTRTVPLEETVQQYTGACTRAYRVTAFRHTFSLPAAPAPEHAAVILRHFQPEVPLLVGKDIQCFVRVVFVQKFRHIPPGRAKHHEPLHFVFEACGAQVVAARLAQHGVDQTGCAGIFEGTGQLDGFVHRSGHRHLHIAGLRQRRAQYFAHRRIQLGKALGQELAQDVVQRAPVFQHRVKDGAGKSFIAAFQLLALEFGIQNKVGKTILLLPHQCRHCRRAGIRRHQRISPVFRR